MFEDYIDPRPNSPFHKGEYVVVGHKLEYCGPQPKRSHKYKGMVGKVIGYKNVPGSYSKYLLEFPNGEKEAFMASLLEGPFENEAIAKKYEGGAIEIVPTDLASRVHKKYKEDYETQPKNEKLLKQYFTSDPFNFEWLDTPQEDKVFAERFNQHESIPCICFILAQSKTHPQHKLIRTNNAKTKKFKDFQYVGPYRGYLDLILRGGYYGFSKEEYETYTHASYEIKSLLETLKNSSAEVSFGIDANKYKGAYKLFPKHKTTKTATDEFLRDYMNCNGTVSGDQYTTASDFYIDLEVLDNPSFLRSFTFNFTSPRNNCFTVKSLNKQNNLMGCPRKINGQFQVSMGEIKKESNIKGAPEVNGQVNLGIMSNVKNPEQLEVAFKNEGKYREMKERMPELEGLF